jgi:hypothetical protein
MDCKVIHSPGAEGIHARIGPHVRAIAAVLAELEIIRVRLFAVLKDEDQLVLFREFFSYAIEGMVALTPREVYVVAPPDYYGPAAYGPPAWTPEWYSYCSYRYRSFNPGTGYFVGRFAGNFSACVTLFKHVKARGAKRKEEAAEVGCHFKLSWLA